MKNSTKLFIVTLVTLVAMVFTVYKAVIARQELQETRQDLVVAQDSIKALNAQSIELHQHNDRLRDELLEAEGAKNISATPQTETGQEFPDPPSTEPMTTAEAKQLYYEINTVVAYWIYTGNNYPGISSDQVKAMAARLQEEGYHELVSFLPHGLIDEPKIYDIP